MRQYTLHIDLNEASVSSGVYTFNHNIEMSIKKATGITLSGLYSSSKTYNAMPAWYLVEDKKLYVGTGAHYFTVSDNRLTYT